MQVAEAQGRNNSEHSTKKLLMIQRTVRSLLFPMSMMVMLGFACCRASSSQLARWLKVSRLHRVSQGLTC